MVKSVAAQSSRECGPADGDGRLASGPGRLAGSRKRKPDPLFTANHGGETEQKVPYGRSEMPVQMMRGSCGSPARKRLVRATVLALGWIMATATAVSALGEPDLSTETVMRDGLRLPLRAWFPGGERPWPVVLIRWYNANPPGHLGAATFLAGGYAFVVQTFRDGKGGDVRGEPGTRFTRDDLDGYDTVEWIAKRPGATARWR